MTTTYKTSTTPSPSLGSVSADETDLAALGYEQKLHRTMSSFTSFCLAFSMVSINTGVVTLFADPFNRVGGFGVLLWLLVIPFVSCIVLVYSHLSTRMPVTGYAYQWSSRLVNKTYGWFTGWIAMISFMAGTAATASAIGSVFAPEIWANPTQGHVQALSISSTILVCAINIFGIKVATKMNDIGAVIELVGSAMLIVALIIGVFFVFTDGNGFGLLVDNTPINGEPLSLTTLALAMLLPVNVLLGWEGAADLAEETLDPRKAAAQAMIRAVAVSSICGVGMFALLALAIPGPVADFLSRPENPVINLVRVRFGNVAALGMLVVAFASIFACLIANMAVATRMIYALSRDNMLPASKALMGVNVRTGTPVGAIVLVTGIAIAMNLASGGFVGALFSMVGLTYYCTYFLTMIAAYYGHRQNRIPPAPEDAFGLGEWLVPTIGLGLLWTLVVIATFSVPEASHPGAVMTLFMLAIGCVWWVVKLRGDLKAGRAGPPDFAPKRR